MIGSTAAHVAHGMLLLIGSTQICRQTSSESTPAQWAAPPMAASQAASAQTCRRLPQSRPAGSTCEVARSTGALNTLKIPSTHTSGHDSTHTAVGCMSTAASDAPRVLPDEIELIGTHGMDVLHSRPYAREAGQILRRPWRHSQQPKSRASQSVVCHHGLFCKQIRRASQTAMCQRAACAAAPAGGTGRLSGCCDSDWMSSRAASCWPRALSSATSSLYRPAAASAARPACRRAPCAVKLRLLLGSCWAQVPSKQSHLLSAADGAHGAQSTGAQPPAGRRGCRAAQSAGGAPCRSAPASPAAQTGRQERRLRRV
jgi:hypothetical protein